MIHRSRIFGMFSEVILEPEERAEVEMIKKRYDLWRIKDERLMRWDIWDLLQVSKTFYEFRAKLINYLDKRYAKKWVRRDNLYLEYDSWLWLIEIENKEVPFDERTLQLHNRADGFIGEFNGLRCFVKY